MYFEYIRWKFAGRLLDRVNIPLMWIVHATYYKLRIRNNATWRLIKQYAVIGCILLGTDKQVTHCSIITPKGKTPLDHHNLNKSCDNRQLTSCQTKMLWFAAVSCRFLWTAYKTGCRPMFKWTVVGLSAILAFMTRRMRKTKIFA